MLISDQTTIVIVAVIALLAIAAFAFGKNVLFKLFGIEFTAKGPAGNTTVGKGVKVRKDGRIGPMIGTEGAGGESGNVSVGEGAEVEGTIDSMTGRKSGPGAGSNDAG